MASRSAVFLDLASVDRGDLDLSALHQAASPWTTHLQTPADLAAARIGDAVVAVTNKVVVDRTVMAACPCLRLICVAATGTNNVDLGAARERGITVSNVTGYATASVVQHVFALILALTTRLAEHAAQVRTHLRKLGEKAYWNQFADAPDRLAGLLGAVHAGGQDAQPAGVRNGRAELGFAYPHHCPAYNRILDTEHFGYCRLHCVLLRSR